MESKVEYRAQADVVDLAYSGKGIDLLLHPGAWLNNQYPVLDNGVFSREDISHFLVVRYGEFVSVELGPGKNKQRLAGIGLNPRSDPTADIWQDLNFGIPLADESVDGLYSNQFLEHLLKSKQIFFWNEMWRVLKPGGIMEHTVPHHLSPDAVSDPTHFTLYSEHSFQYYCLDDKGRPFVESFSDYGIECRFELLEIHVRREVDIMVRMRKPK